MKIVPRAVLADEYTRDFQTGCSLKFVCNYPNLFLLIKSLHLKFLVQVYAAEVRDRTQTSDLIRYGFQERVTKLMIFFSRANIFLYLRCLMFFFLKRRFCFLCRNLNDMFPLSDLGHLKRVRCLKNGKGKLTWVRVSLCILLK